VSSFHGRHVDRISEIRLHQSTHIHSRNNPAKFHPDQIGNNGALGFFVSGRPNKNENNNNEEEEQNE